MLRLQSTGRVLVGLILVAMTAQALPPPAYGIWNIEPVWSKDNDAVGSYHSIALTSTGRPAAVFYSGEQETAYYAERTLTGWTYSPLLVYSGSEAALTFDASDRPHIIFGGVSQAYLTRTESGWVNNPIPAPAFRTQIVLGSDGTPHVAYRAPGSITAYAVLDPMTGTWQTETVDDVSTGSVDIAVDSLGRPHLVYGTDDMGASNTLRYATKTPSGWVYEDVATLCNFHVALDIDAADNLHASCNLAGPNGCGLGYATKISGVWSFEVADAMGGGIRASPACNVGLRSDIAVTPDGIPHISYYVKNCCGEATDRVHHATKAPGGWRIEVVDRTGENTGASSSSIVVDADGAPHMVYDALETVICGCEELRYARPLMPSRL